MCQNTKIWIHYNIVTKKYLIWKHSKMDWLNRLKTKFQRIYFKDKDRVIGIDLFHDYFQYQVLLVSRNAEEYIAGIYPFYRRLIAYGQNLNMWLTAIRFQLLFWSEDKWLKDWLGDPFVLDSPMIGRLLNMTLSMLIAVATTIGKLMALFGGISNLKSFQLLEKFLCQWIKPFEKRFSHSLII